MTTGRVWRRAATALAVLGAATVVAGGTAAGADTGAGAAAGEGENPAAAQAVQALAAGDSRAADAVPGDFAAVMGYRPRTVDGTLANPYGDCSSPVPLPGEFDTACKVHDLGYDLLRYARESGGELGPWARRSLDERLDADMHAACEVRADPRSRAFCSAMADVAITAVGGNSWRQGYVTPVDETGTAVVLGGGAAALGVIALRGALGRRRPQAVPASYSAAAVTA